MSTDNKEILTKETMFPLFDEAFNMGVDRCIEVVKGLRLPEGWTQLDDFKSLVNIKLSQLKKPS